MDTFWHEEAETILGIPISKRRGKDKLIWRIYSKGIFTVKSAYYATCQNMRKDNCSTSACNKKRKL